MSHWESSFAVKAAPLRTDWKEKEEMADHRRTKPRKLRITNIAAGPCWCCHHKATATIRIGKLVVAEKRPLRKYPKRLQGAPGPRPDLE